MPMLRNHILMSVILKVAITTLALGLLSTTFLFGQSSSLDDSKVLIKAALADKSRADSLLQINAFDSAMHYSRKSVNVLKEVDWNVFMRVCNELSFKMYEDDQNDHAKNLALLAKQEGEDSLDIKAVLRYGENRLAPRELGTEYDLLANTYRNLAVINVKNSNYDQAYRYLTHALTLKELVYGEGSDQLINIYFHFSDLYYFSGSYKKSLFANLQGLNIQMRQLHESHYFLADTYKKIGHTYLKLNNLDKALINFEKARDVYERNAADGLNPAEIKSAYTNIAKVYTERGEYDKAMEYSYKALDVLEKYYEPSNKDVAFNFINIADAYKEQEQYEQALAYYDSAKVNKKKYLPKNHPDIANIRLKIGGLYDQMGNYDLASEEYETIINSLSGNIKQENTKDTTNTGDKNISENSLAVDQSTIDLRNVSSYTHYLEALNAKAHSLELSYQSSQEPEKLNNALTTYLMAANVIDTMNVLSRPQGYKPLSEETIEETYENGIRLAYVLYKDATNPEKQRAYLKNAFDLVEKSRYFKLLSAIKSPTVRYSQTNGTKLDSLIDNEKVTTNKLASVKRDLLDEEQLGTISLTNDKRKFLKTRIDSLEKTLVQLRNIIKTDHPNYFQFRYRYETLNIQDIHDRLINELPETAIVQYYMGKNLGFVFIFSQSGIQLEQFEIAPIEDVLENLLEALHDKEVVHTLPLKGYKQFTKNAWALYHHILAPPLASIQNDPITNLVVIPDGKLTFIPFEALLTEEVTERLYFQNLPYLLNQYVINYAYGMEFFWKDLSTPRSPNAKTYSGWTVPYEYYQIRVAFDEQVLKKFDSNTKETLARSKQEISLVNSVMNGEVFSGPKASEVEFLDKVNNYSINHLSLNCFVFANKPIDSKLLFFNATNNDDFLNMYEVYGSPIESELLVLGATTPIEEELEKVDGYLNLSRAFSYAGCPSLVTSLWRAEEVAPEMMKNFFDELQDGKAVNISLHQAKQQFLQQNNPDKAHPYYWAGLIAVGNPSAVVKRGIGVSALLTFIAGVLVLLIVGGIVYWYLVERKEEME